MNEQHAIETYQGHTLDDMRRIAASLSDERRMYGGGDDPIAVTAACLRRHADMLDAYGRDAGISSLIGNVAVLLPSNPSHAADYVRRVADARRETCEALSYQS